MTYNLFLPTQTEATRRRTRHRMAEGCALEIISVKRLSNAFKSSQATLQQIIITQNNVKSGESNMQILPVQGTFSLRILMKCQFEREVQNIRQKGYFFTMFFTTTFSIFHQKMSMLFVIRSQFSSKTKISSKRGYVAKLQL